MSAKARGVDWSLDEFLAMVSHELRNPTQAILGWAEVIGSRPLNDEALSRAIGVIPQMFFSADDAHASENSPIADEGVMG